MCSALTATKARPKALADVPEHVGGSFVSLARAMKDGVVRDVGRQLSTTMPRRTQLLGIADFKKSITEAVANAKAIFTKALASALTEVAKAVGAALTQAMSSVKVELQTQADKAVALATSALGKMKETLAQIPTSIQSTVGTLCQPLPGAELQVRSNPPSNGP